MLSCYRECYVLCQRFATGAGIGHNVVLAMSPGS